MGKPSDIADACLFLGSDLASYINGQEIYVDGGWLSKGLKKINFDETKKNIYLLVIIELVRIMAQ